jgi:hypothetical protein
VKVIDSGLRASAWSLERQVRPERIDTYETSAGDDAFGVSAFPNTAYGASGNPAEPFLEVGDYAGLGSRARAYLNFYLGGGVFEPGTQVTKAELYVYCIASRPAGSYWVDVFRAVGSTWDEWTVTWDTAPDDYDPVWVSTTNVGGSNGDWCTFDVTAPIHGLLGSPVVFNPDITFVLQARTPAEGTSGPLVDFMSSEHTDPVHHPYIKIWYASGVPIAVPEQAEAGPRVILEPSFPNPTSGPTTIHYTIPEAGAPVPVRLEVFDLQGRRIRVLEDALRPPGHYEARWDARDSRGALVAGGIYFCRLVTGKEPRQALKIVLLP